MTPTWFLVCRTLRNLAQSLNNPTRNPGNRGRNHRSRRRVHKRHKLVRETGHSTSDADTADVWTTPDPVHPTAFGDVAVHHRSPASQFHYALRRAVNISKVSLFIIAASVTAFVYSFAEQPFRS